MTNERCRLISESQWREYQELVTKCHRLEEQVEDANFVIKHYDKKDLHYTLEDGTVMGNGYAHKYLLKWGVK